MTFYFRCSTTAQRIDTLIKTQLRLLIQIGLIGVSCFFVSPSVAEQTILIIKNNASSVHNLIGTQVENKLQKSLPNANVSLLNVETYNPKNLVMLEPALIITLGKKAAKQVQFAASKKLFTLIPESFYPGLMDCEGDLCSPPGLNYTIPLDQPLLRQLNFLRILLPDAVKIGTLTSQNSIGKVRKLEGYIKDTNLELIYDFLSNESSLNNKLDDLLGLIDAFLALPDPLIHNRNSIQHFLLLTYRKKIPVIGFSNAYVNSGAIGAVYSTPKQISRQISELTVKIVSVTPPESGTYPPEFFNVAINKHVVKSLDLIFPSKKAVKSKLLALEK